MIKFYRQKTSRILALQKFLSTPYSDLLPVLAQPLSIKEVDSFLGAVNRPSGKAFHRIRFVEKLRTGEDNGTGEKSADIRSSRISASTPLLRILPTPISRLPAPAW